MYLYCLPYKEESLLFSLLFLLLFLLNIFFLLQPLLLSPVITGTTASTTNFISTITFTVCTVKEKMIHDVVEDSKADFIQEGPLD